MKAGWLANLPPYRFDQSEKMWAGVLIVGSVYIGLFEFLPSFDRLAWPCLWKKFTGIECVGCGFTRGCAALIRMDWTAAFRFNPLVLLIASFLAWKLLEIVFGLGTGKSLQAMIPQACRFIFIAGLVVAGFILLVWRVLNFMQSV